MKYKKFKCHFYTVNFRVLRVFSFFTVRNYCARKTSIALLYRKKCGRTESFWSSWLNFSLAWGMGVKRGLRRLTSTYGQWESMVQERWTLRVTLKMSSTIFGTGRAQALWRWRGWSGGKRPRYWVTLYLLHLKSIIRYIMRCFMS